jgi:methanogenic corrinoid protein MtbC1
MNDKSADNPLIALVADLEEHDAVSVVRERVRSGDSPFAIVEDLQEGMRQVGERYERQEYYLSALIMAGEIFGQSMEILQPILEKELSGTDSGTVLLGTVQGDIHDIGKNSLRLLLHCNGFTVHDLGVDVPPSEFLLQATQVRPDIIGLSGLLTSSYDAMRETINLIRIAADDDLRSIPIIIGGNQLTEQVCHYVGADHWVRDAMLGVRLCLRLVKEQGGH